MSENKIAGKLFREIRHLHGMNMKEFGAIFKLKSSDISNIENGYVEVSSEIIDKYNAYFHPEFAILRKKFNKLIEDNKDDE